MKYIFSLYPFFHDIKICFYSIKINLYLPYKIYILKYFYHMLLSVLVRCIFISYMNFSFATFLVSIADLPCVYLQKSEFTFCMLVELGCKKASN